MDEQTFDVVRTYTVWLVATVKAESREAAQQMLWDEEIPDTVWRETGRDLQDTTIEPHYG